MTTDPRQLLALLERFVQGEDVSLDCAHAIELALDERFPSDDLMQDAVLMLASYRPGGGPYLHDEHAIRQCLTGVQRRLGRLA